MAGDTMAARIDSLGFYPGMFSSYANQVMLNDLTDSCYYPQLVNPAMTMNGSIFPGMGMGVGMGTYPMMPGFTGGAGYSQEDYFKYMDKNQDFMIDYQVKQQQKMRNADMRLNSPEEAVVIAGQRLREKIMSNEQQQIQEAYNAYVAEVQSLYGCTDVNQVKGRASMLYQKQFGTSIVEDLRKHGRSSFTQGFLQTATLGFADKKTAEQNIAQITGQPVGRSENAKKIAGNVVGGTVLGAGVAVSANFIMKALKVGLKSKPFIAGIIGAAAGLLAAVFTANKD